VNARACRTDGVELPGDMLDGSTRSCMRELWQLAWPAICHQLLVTLVFVADRLLVGRYHATALASLQLSTTISWTLYSVLAAFGVGTLAVIARLVGAKRHRAGALAARASLTVALSLGCAVALPLWLCSGVLVDVLFPMVEPEIAALAVDYLRYFLPALPFALCASVAVACLQAHGDTVTPLGAAIGANAINVALSGALIFGLGGMPELGVSGAAIGSAVALSLECALLMGVIGRRGMLRTNMSLGRQKLMLGQLLRVSLPALGERLAYHLGYLVFVAMIATLGGVAMATNQVLISIEAAALPIAEGLGIAAGTMAAQKLGARRGREAAAVWMLATMLATVALGVVGVLFAVAPQLWMSVFSSDPEVVALGGRTLYLAAAAQPLMALAVVGSTVLRSVGATRQALWLTLVCAVGVRLAAGWMFCFALDWGLLGAWLASGIDWLVHAGLLIMLFRRRSWR
jgi:MATE family multidrug resistance protein